jgi:protein-S-isoprenylcysteine O-methyltransferase Ste14
MLSAFTRGRVAEPARPAWNLMKTLAQTLVFWSVFLALIPSLLFEFEARLGLAGARFGAPGYPTLGAALFLAGGCLGLWSGATMAWLGADTPLPVDCPRSLVIAGPYRFIRNPMAVAGIGQGVAVGAALGSPSVVLYALAGAPLWNLFVRGWEERDLAARFGEPYLEYQRRIPCWYPTLSPMSRSAAEPSAAQPKGEDVGG